MKAGATLAMGYGAFCLWVMAMFLHFRSLRAVSVMAGAVPCSGGCIWVQGPCQGRSY